MMKKRGKWRALDRLDSSCIHDILSMHYYYYLPSGIGTQFLFRKSLEEEKRRKLSDMQKVLCAAGYIYAGGRAIDIQSREFYF